MSSARTICMAALVLQFVACTESIPETVEDCRAYGEARFDTEAPAEWTTDRVGAAHLLFVVEKPLRGSVEHIIREAALGFAHPSFDSAWMNDFVAMRKMTRVFVIERSEVERVLPILECRPSRTMECPTLELPSAELYAPGYGFGTTNEEFTARLSCLLSGEEGCRSESGVRMSSLWHGADVVWISDRDSCAAAGDGCDVFQEILALQRELFLVVPLPINLNIEQGSGAIGVRPSQALAGLRMHDVSSECAEAFPDAHAPRALFETASKALADNEADILALPLCAATTGSLVTQSIASLRRWDVLSYYSYFRCTESFLNLVPDDHGRVPCTLTETLPKVGPITRCSQLADRGRELLEISQETGRETCLIQQLPVVDNIVGAGHGYAYGKLHHAAAESMGLQAVCPGRGPEPTNFWVANDFATVPGSSSQFLCTTVDETAPACSSTP